MKPKIILRINSQDTELTQEEAEKLCDQLRLLVNGTLWALLTDNTFIEHNITPNLSIKLDITEGS